MDTLNLFIQVRDGLPINHPAYELNLLDAFGKVPDDWEPFIRVPNPAAENSSILLTHPEPVYRKIDGVWQDVWFYRDKTAEELESERQARLAPVIAQFARHPYAHNFTAWVLNEDLLRYEPPIPRPSGPGLYRWSGPDNNWKLAEPVPRDGKQYYFDFDNWVNVEITDVPSE